MVTKHKLGILITGLGMGGAENHLLKLVPKLKPLPCIISLTKRNEIGKVLKKKGIHIHYLNLNIFTLPQTILQFRHILKKEKITILDTYLIHANLWGRFFGKLFGVKKLINSVRSDYSYMKILNFLDKITSLLVDIYVPNSTSLIPYLLKNGIPKNKIRVITNGIDLKVLQQKINSSFNIRKELHLPKKTIICTCIGSMRPVKSTLTAIKALQKIPDIHLVLAGEGPDKKRLEQLTKKLFLEKRVHFLGQRNDSANILHSSDIFILPSIIEGMSNSLLEAMALGKTCIVSDIPQNKELIKTGSNGLTFAVKDSNDLSKKIKKALTTKHKYGHNAQKTIKERFEMKKIVKKYKELIRTCAE